MRPQRIVFVDTETTTLSPRTGHVWEIGLILRDPAISDQDLHRSWLVEPRSMKHADPMSLQIGRYYERTQGCQFANEYETAREFARLTAGATFVAKNPAFDAGFLDKFLRLHDQAPAWDYRLVDVGDLYLGWCAGWRHIAAMLPDLTPFDDDPHNIGRLRHNAPDVPESTSLDEICLALGLPLDGYTAHEALSDARQARDAFDVIAPFGPRR